MRGLGKFLPLLGMVSLFAMAQGVRAQTWLGTNSSNWSTGLNWSTGTAPASAAVTFNTNGGATNVNLDQAFTASGAGITFDTANAAAYTFSTTNSSIITIGGNAGILINSTVTNSQTFNVGFSLGGNGNGATYYLTNNSTTAGQLLTIGGNMSGGSGSTAGVKTLSVGGSGNTLITGTLSRGNGSSLVVSKNGTGTLTLTANNSANFNGGATLNAGTLAISNNAALGTGALTFASNSTTLDARLNNMRITNNQTLAASVRGTYNVGSGLTFTNGGLISGAGGFTKTGAGVMVLTNANTFSNGAVINAGTVSFAGSQSVGSSNAANLSFLGINGGTAIFGTAGTTNNIGTSYINMGSAAGGGASSTVLITNGAEVAFAGGRLNVGSTNGATTNQVFLGTGGTLTSAGFVFVGAGGAANQYNVITNAGGNLNLSGDRAFTIGRNVSSSTNIYVQTAGTASVTALTIAAQSTNNNNQFLLTGGTFDVTSSAYGTTLGGGIHGAYLQSNNINLFSNGGGDFSTYRIQFGDDRLVTNSTGLTNRVVLGGGTTTVGAGGIVVNYTNTFGAGRFTNQVIWNGGVLQAGAASANFLGNLSNTLVTISNNGGVFDVNGYTNTIAANMSGAGGLTVTNSSATAGRLILSGANSYSGGTALNAGTLVVISTNNNLGTNTAANAITFRGGTLSLTNPGAVILANNLVIQTNTGSTIESAGAQVDFTGSMSGGGTLTTVGSARTYMKGSAASFTGAIDKQGGRLDFYAISSSANARYNLNGSSGTYLMGGSGTAWNFGSLNGTNTLINNTATASLSIGALGLDDVFSGAITEFSLGSQTLSITKVGGGTLTLSGSSTYQGGTTVNNGTLKVGNNAALGASTAALVNNATLDLAGFSVTQGTLSGNGVITNSSGSASTFTVGGAAVSNNYTGTIVDGASGTVALVKSGSGTQTLSGANAYTGGTAINAGVLQLGNAGALASSGDIGFGGGTLTYGSGITTDLSGRIKNSASAITLNSGANDIVFDSAIDASNVGGLSKSGSGTLTLNGVNAFSGNTTISAGTLQVGGSGQLGGGTYNGTIANAGTFAYSSSANQTLGGVISGAGALSQNGSGTLTLTNANTYTGSTAVNAGRLVLSGRSTSTNFSVAANSVLELNVSDSAVLIDPATTRFSGSGTLQKTGAGGVVWSSSAATFALSAGSLIDVQGGTFTGGSSANENWTANQSALNVASGALFSGVEANVRVDALSGSGTISSGFTGAGYTNFTFGVANGSGTFSGELANRVGFTTNHLGNYVKVGSGTQVLSGVSTYGGTTTVSAGALVISGQLGSGNYAGNITNSASLVFSNTSSQTLGGVISGVGTLTKAGAGTLVLTNANTYSGGTTLSAGRINVNNASALGTGAFTIAGGSIDNTSGSSRTITNAMNLNGDFTYAGSGALSQTTGAVALGANRQITVTANTLSLGGVVSGSGFSLTKAGAGTLVLTNANTYSGGTVLGAGVLQMGNASALGSSGNIDFEGGTLTYGSGITADLSARIKNSASAIAIDSGANFVTFASAVDSSNLGGLSKSGSGTLSLNATNAFAGDITISAGTLQIGGAGRLGSAGTNNAAIANSGSFVFASSANQTLGGAITGNGTLTRSGTGALTLSASNSYSGGTLITNSTGGGIIATASGALGSGSVTVASGASLALSGGITLTNDVYGSGGGVTAATNGFAAGSRGFVQSMGVGTSTYAGNIYVTGGSTTRIGLQEGSSLNITGSIISTNAIVYFRSGLAGDWIQLSNTNSWTQELQIFGNSTNGGVRLGVNNALSTNAGILSLSGSSVNLDLNGLNQTLRYLTGNNGTTVINNRASGTSTLTLNTTNISASTANITIADGPDGGKVALVKNGSGTQTLAAASAYTGGTTLNEGALVLGNANALGTGELTINGGTLNLNGNNLSQSAFTQSGGELGTNGSTQTLTASTYSLNGGTVNANLGAGTINVGGNATLNGTAAAATVNVNSGTFTLGGTNLLSSAATAAVSGTLNLGGKSQTLAGLTGSGTVTNASGGILTLNVGSGTNSFNGSLQGAGGLTKSGGGVLNLTGANDYSGGTALNEGTLAVSSVDGAGSGDVTLADTTLFRYSGAGGTMANNFTVGGGTGTIQKIGRAHV